MRDTFSGMDIGQVRALAARLRTEASDIEATIQRLTGRLTSVDWKGRDRERFVDEWQSRHVAALRRVVSGLEQAADHASEYANLQEWASEA